MKFDDLSNDEDADQCRLISGECADDCPDQIMISRSGPIYCIHLLFKIILFALLVLSAVSVYYTGPGCSPFPFNSILQCSERFSSNTGFYPPVAKVAGSI